MKSSSGRSSGLEGVHHLEEDSPVGEGIFQSAMLALARHLQRFGDGRQGVGGELEPGPRQLQRIHHVGDLDLASQPAELIIHELQVEGGVVADDHLVAQTPSTSSAT